MRTLFDVIHVVPIDELDSDVRRLPSGLYIAEVLRSEKEMNATQSGIRKGQVLVVGPECHTLKVGVRVVYCFGQYIKITDDNNKVVHVMHEKDCLATCE